ncbi:hypothetical protein [Streptomyces sp. NPDC002276]
MSTTQVIHRIGEADHQCHYPVYVHDGGPERLAGTIYRWHRVWYARPVGTDTETRITGASKGDRTPLSLAAAQHLADEVAAGRITPQTPAEDATAAPTLPVGPSPLLHPRLKINDTNVTSAHRALDGLALHLWRPLGGYPGADNPWALQCLMPGCEWWGPRYWSHLRGRNGNPPSTHRHDRTDGKPGTGCAGDTAVRALIPAYRS